MNIAELFVRIRGDVSDINPKMRTVQKSLDGVSSSAGGSHASMGRLGQEVVTLTRRLLGLNPVVAQAANVLGGLAIGSTAMIGILGGVAAVGFAINKVTEDSRKAMETGDKLIASYTQLARISALGTSGQQKADIEDINKALEQHNKWLGFIIAARTQLGSLGGLFGKDVGGHSAQIQAGVAARAAAEQQRVNAQGLQDAKDNEAWAKRIKDEHEAAAAAAKKAQADFLAGISSSLSVFDNFAAHGTASSAVNARLIEDYKKLAAQIRDIGAASSPAVAELLKLRDALMANLVVAQAVAAANSKGTVGPLVGKTLPGVSATANGALADAQNALGHTPNVGGPAPIVKVESALERQTRLEKENHDRLVDVISNTASQTAQIIGNAILSFGSGRGSQIGGALGGAIGGGIGGYFGHKAGEAVGGYLGAAVGSAIPVVGTIVGGFLGSALGGLFGGHARSIDRNTIALNNLTAQLSNAPGGFKVAGYNYSASTARKIYRQQVETARRESTRGGRAGFALQAGM